MPQRQRQYNFMVPQPNFAEIKSNALAQKAKQEDMRIKQNKMVQDQKKAQLEAKKAKVEMRAKLLKLTTDKQDQLYDLMDKTFPMVTTKETVDPQTGQPQTVVDMDSLEQVKQLLYPQMLELYGGDAEKANEFMRAFEEGGPEKQWENIQKYMVLRKTGEIQKNKKEEKKEPKPKAASTLGKIKQDVQNGFLTPEEGAAAMKGKAEKADSSGSYTPQQKVDDTRGYYQVLMKTMLDEDGFIKSGQEQAYSKLTDNMTEDLRRIKEGKEPSWYDRPKKEAGETETRKKNPKTGEWWTYSQEAGKWTKE